VKEEHPAATFGELSKIIGRRWSEMSPADKTPYADLEEADKVPCTPPRPAWSVCAGTRSQPLCAPFSLVVLGAERIFFARSRALNAPLSQARYQAQMAVYLATARAAGPPPGKPPPSSLVLSGHAASLAPY
jgi:hypothetical protein